MIHIPSALAHAIAKEYPVAPPKTDRIGDWMQTFSGRQFWPLDPRPVDISLIDIAHALSNTCRFGGHCKHFYSVAEHSILVERILCGFPEFKDLHFKVRTGLRLAAMLHDATEAYLVDVPTPIKRSLADYKTIEHRMARVIEIKFELGHGLLDDPMVKRADRIALMTEAEQVFGTKPAAWRETAVALPIPLNFYHPSSAKHAFLRSVRAFLPEQLCEY